MSEFRTYENGTQLVPNKVDYWTSNIGCAGMRFNSTIIIILVLNICIHAELVIKKPLINYPTKFAIVVDSATYNNAGDAIDAYKNAVEADGLSTYILINDWENPDQIRNEVVKLYKQLDKTLEGIVLVGDIPIPMIRNAEHLTSSDKLNKSYSTSLARTSVPSDRFYDDFKLKFSFIKQDNQHPLYFYYSLSPNSPQKIDKDIYSARIKPSAVGKAKYEIIRKYLFKVVEQKKYRNYVDNALIYTGYGYHSESLTSWSDEQLALREEFPQLFRPGGRLVKLNYTMSPNGNIKESLLRELQDDNLDLAIFHAHGDEDVQYLREDPKLTNFDDNVDYIKYYLRNKLREAVYQRRSSEETINYYVQKYGVPKEWFKDAFDYKTISADSLMDRKMSIYIDDVRKINPNAKFILFDECYNGSFQLDHYIAGEYIFGNGNTIAGIANSTTVLQDYWSLEFIGLLNYGLRLGQLHRMNNLLESHLIGDPTYHFTSISDIDLNQMIVLNAKNTNFWQKMMASESVPLRTLGVYMMYKNLGLKFENNLVNLYHSESSFNVRLHALKYLAELNTNKFEDVLKESINDPFEFIRRITAIWMGKVGRREYLNLMAKQLLNDESERVVFNLKRSIVLIDPELAYDECAKIIDEMPGNVDKDDLKHTYKSIFLNSKKWLNEELLANIKNSSLRTRRKINEVTNFKIYNFIQAIPELLQVASDKKEDVEVRVAILEALGYYGFAHNRDIIIKGCDDIINNEKNPQEVRDEALRTKIRIIDGFNNPITS